MQVNVRVCFLVAALLCLHSAVSKPIERTKRQSGPVLFPSATGNQIPQNTGKPSTTSSGITASGTTAQTATGTTTTTASPQYRTCFSSCQTTPEYNPVCGTNGITYDSAARLLCARRCGTVVEVAFIGRCQGL